MIYPQEDQTELINIYTTLRFPYTVGSLVKKSPTLPLHFDRKYLPKDLCEKEILKLSECILLYNLHEDQKEVMCSLEASKFEVCRKRRDLRIVSAIYHWETKHLGSLDKDNRGLYLRGLGFKLDRLQGDLRRQPSTVTGLARITELQVEIKQLKWRLDYLNKFKTE